MRVYRLAAPLLGCVLTAGAATPVAADHIIYLESRGCTSCTVNATAVYQPPPGGSWRHWMLNVGTTLYQGRSVLVVPDRFTSVSFEVATKQGWSGLNSWATVVGQYKGHEPGGVVSNRTSRRSGWARVCVDVDQAETWVKFRVVKVRVPKRKNDPYPELWDPYVLRAWAVPTLQSDNAWTPTNEGRTSQQQAGCDPDWGM